MLKSARVKLLTIGAAAAAAFGFAAAAHAAPAGPYAGLCAAGKPAVLARVTGFKSAQGTVAVKLYASDKSFLEDGAYLRKVEIPVTSRGPVEICVPVPSSGRYAISVRHEVGPKKSRSDGGGLSGNPKVTVMDTILGRKPSLQEVSFGVNGATKVVPVVLNYLQGTSLKPIG